MTTRMTTSPYGSWPSPVTVEVMTAATVGLSAPAVDSTDVYWLEARASEGGRTSLWRRSGDGATVELTPAPFNVRSRVNEYGGGEYAVDDGIVVFSNFADGRLYRVGPGTEPEAITPEAKLRFGDLRVHAAAGLVLAVREDHREAGEAVTTIVQLDLDGDNADGGLVLCSGADFYSSPELSTDGRLAWVEWNHPNMPWDSTSIKVGRLEAGTLEGVRQVAGGPGESAVYPGWTRAGLLIFVSDRSDWWNLYRLDPADHSAAAEALAPAPAEFALPAWQLGGHPYAIVDDHQLISVMIENGAPRLVVVDTSSGTVTSLTDGTDSTGGVAYADGVVACVVRSAERSARVATQDLATDLVPTSRWTVVRAATQDELDPAFVSVPRPLTWPGEFGEVHGWFYPPHQEGMSAPAGTLPPLIVQIHGGPTSMATNAFSLGYQFWTSRGVAVLDVNYGGSTGYGRAYRERLQGQWGVVDVADCVAGAAAVGEQGLADPERLVIMGGSAGGYTTLQALTTSDVFAAGVSLYGIGDLEAMTRDTHKFESRYLDGLVGPYPEAAELYRERSPMHHVDRLASPILLLQGADDAVVPPNQAETMADAVRAKGLPVAMIIFPGEGHGFRRSETIRTALQAELYFLGRVLDFEPADELPAVTIDNLPVESPSS